MGTIAKEIAHTRTPLNNCEPIVVIIILIIEYIYIKGKNEKERCQWKVLKAKGAKSGK